MGSLHLIFVIALSMEFASYMSLPLQRSFFFLLILVGKGDLNGFLLSHNTRAIKQVLDSCLAWCVMNYAVNFQKRL